MYEANSPYAQYEDEKQKSELERQVEKIPSNKAESQARMNHNASQETPKASKANSHDKSRSNRQAAYELSNEVSKSSKEKLRSPRKVMAGKRESLPVKPKPTAPPPDRSYTFDVVGSQKSVKRENTSSKALETIEKSRK